MFLVTNFTRSSFLDRNYYKSYVPKKLQLLKSKNVVSFKRYMPSTFTFFSTKPTVIPKKSYHNDLNQVQALHNRGDVRNDFALFDTQKNEGMNMVIMKYAPKTKIY